MPLKEGPETMMKSVSNSFIKGVITLLEEARRYSARAVNSVMTATYWEIGRRIVKKEQKGKVRARYGENLIENLSQELTIRFGRGFSRHNLQQMRTFYLFYPEEKIRRTPSSRFPQLREFEFQELSKAFPLSWSQYVLLLSVKTDSSRKFYETEAIRGGWSVRQLERQINSQFYERTALSRNKESMLIKGARPRLEDRVTQTAILDLQIWKKPQRAIGYIGHILKCYRFQPGIISMLLNPGAAIHPAP